ncbi:MAG: lysophospholipid acyltransferase family protein [Deltaproteobacteria bacterium]|nr:lysophospholipid acyltransferase family protein [Deltaproteobacteria bacterium]
MGRSARGFLHLQYAIGRLAVFLMAPFVYLCVRLCGYRVRDLKKIRRECAVLFENHRGPWIICPNHLTNIDSAIVAYAIAPMHAYMMNFRLLPWNLPERANFQRHLFSKLMCYIAKCIPVSRGGDREEMKSVLEKCTYLLRRRQPLLIFPEGGRSRTARINVENFTYGVGRFVSSEEDCKVLCIYLRGDHQDTYTNIPRLGERFSNALDVLIPPRTEQNGLRAQRYYAEQIINRLSKMEGAYFEARRQRHSGSTASACAGQEQEYTLPETHISP